MTSFKSANLPSDRGAIEYKRPTVVLLLAILTLYPTSSPLFHVLCLPVLTLLHRHDTRLFILYTSICIGSVSYTADLRGGREIVSAGIHCVLGVGIVVESILAHQALVAMLWRSAWSDSLLFSLIWSGCGIISRAIHFNAFTPSSARYECLRFLSRNLGDIGVDLFLAITGYAVFMVFEVFFPAPTARDRELWELIEMIPLDRDASVLDDSVETIPQEHPESPPYTSEGTSLIDSPPESASTKSYGTTQRFGDDLIDLESGRSYSGFSIPSNPAHRIARSTLRPDFGCGASSVDSDETLVPSEISVDDLLAELLALRPKSTRYLKRTVLIIMLFWTIIFALPLPEQVSLSASLTDHTPLSVACIIPPTGYTSADLTHLSQTVSGRAKLVIWPDDLVVQTEWQRDVLVEDVHQAIGIQYGVWTLISVLVNATGVKERILAGPEGGVRPGEGGTDWTVYIPPPTGVTRFNWTTNFPHYRPLHFAATTPKLHRIISDTADPLSLLIVPSRSTTTVRLAHSQELTIKHGTPAILCTSTLSAVIDPAGRILFQQSGGQTWSLGLALWYKEGEDRQRTGYENGYGGWLLGTVVTILSIRATISFIDKINKAETETGAGSATDVNVSGRDMCSSLNPIPSRTLPWSSRK